MIKLAEFLKEFKMSVPGYRTKEFQAILKNKNVKSNKDKDWTGSISFDIDAKDKEELIKILKSKKIDYRFEK